MTGCRSEHHTPPHPLRTWTRPTLPPGLARCAGKQHGWVTDYGSSIGCRRLCFCYLPLWLCRGAEYTGWVGSWSARSEVGRPGGGAPREWVRYREVGGVVWRMAGRWSDWFCRANTSSQGDTNSRTVSLWYFIFTHKHTMNFSTQDTKKSSTAKGCFFFFGFFLKSCTREDLEAVQISKNKKMFYTRWTMNYESGPPETWSMQGANGNGWSSNLTWRSGVVGEARFTSWNPSRVSALFWPLLQAIATALRHHTLWTDTHTQSRESCESCSSLASVDCRWRIGD